MTQAWLLRMYTTGSLRDFHPILSDPIMMDTDVMLRCGMNTMWKVIMTMVRLTTLQAMACTIIPTCWLHLLTTS